LAEEQIAQRLAATHDEMHHHIEEEQQMEAEWMRQIHEIIDGWRNEQEEDMDLPEDHNKHHHGDHWLENMALADLENFMAQHQVRITLKLSFG
jgi:hypothetical protein